MGQRLCTSQTHISIHALHEESDALSISNNTADTTCTSQTHISIHALHEESDKHQNETSDHHAISIHALHEESDVSDYASGRTCRHFNPRSP